MNNKNYSAHQPQSSKYSLLHNSAQKVKYFLFRKNKLLMFTLIFIMILCGIIPAINSILLEKLTDIIAENNSEEIVKITGKWVFIYILWQEVINFSWRSYDYVYLKAIPVIRNNLIYEYFDHAQYHEHKFFQSNLAGDITNKIMQASDAIEWIFAYLNEKILRKIFILISSLIVLAMVNKIIASIFLIWLILFLGVSLFFTKNVNKYSNAYGRNKAKIAGIIVDCITNIFAIKMFTSHKSELRNLSTYLNNTIKSDQAMQWFLFKLRYALGLMCSIMMGIMIYAIIKLKQDNIISTGECVLIITLITSTMSEIWDLTQEFGDVFEQIGFFDQTTSLLDQHKITNKVGAKDIIIKNPTIEFKNVTFKYKENQNIFNNQSVFIKAKEKIGLAGFSGSGKTTFTNLIIRLFDIQEGEILIDNQNIKNVTIESLHKAISVIPQEPVLFHRSIMENITYGNNDIPMEKVIEAAKKAHIHDAIMELPMQYQTICGERGNNLSGGQKQRIIIARAILKDTPIVILDEPTSSLDSKSEYLIHKSLENLTKDKTTLVIAHRLSTLKNMDKIFVFDGGRIVEQGSHQELLNNTKTNLKDSVYKNLWEYL